MRWTGSCSLWSLGFGSFSRSARRLGDGAADPTSVGVFDRDSRDGWEGKSRPFEAAFPVSLSFFRSGRRWLLRLIDVVGDCFVFFSWQELVRLQSMLEDERDLLSFALANIFFAYDRVQEGKVLLRYGIVSTAVLIFGPIAMGLAR